MPDEKTTVARNAILLVGVEVGTKVLDLILAIVVANKLGAETFGLLNYAYGVGLLAALLPNFGLDVMTVRDVAADRDRGGSYLVNGAAVKLLLTPVALAGVLVFALAAGDGPRALIVILLASLIVLSDGFLRFVNAFFRARQVMQYEALARSCLSIVNVATGLGVLLTGHGLLVLLGVRLGVYLTAVVATSVLLVTRRLFTVPWRPRLSAMRALVRRTAPLAVLAAFTIVFVSIDTVMIGLMRGKAEVGIYSAARRFTFVVLLMAGAFTEAVLPAMARRLGKGAGVTDMLRVATRLLLIMALPLVGWFTWYCNAWVGIIFSPAYSMSAVVLAISSWALLFDFMNHAGNRALIAHRREGPVLYIVAGAAVFNIVTNALLIPRYGAPGAALTTVATEILVFVAQTAMLARRGVRLPLREFIGPLAAFLAMALALWGMLWLGAPWYMGAPVAGLIYLAALPATGAVSRREIGFFLSLLRSPGSFLSNSVS